MLLSVSHWLPIGSTPVGMIIHPFTHLLVYKSVCQSNWWTAMRLTVCVVHSSLAFVLVLKENHFIKLEMLPLGLNKVAKCLVYSRYSELKFSSFLVACFFIKLLPPSCPQEYSVWAFPWDLDHNDYNIPCPTEIFKSAFNMISPLDLATNFLWMYGCGGPRML